MKTQIVYSSVLTMYGNDNCCWVISLKKISNCLVLYRFPSGPPNFLLQSPSLLLFYFFLPLRFSLFLTGKQNRRNLEVKLIIYQNKYNWSCEGSYLWHEVNSQRCACQLRKYAFHLLKKECWMLTMSFWRLRLERIL